MTTTPPKPPTVDPGRLFTPPPLATPVPTPTAPPPLGAIVPPLPHVLVPTPPPAGTHPHAPAGFTGPARETDVSHVTLTIDGESVNVLRGTNVLEAARNIGKDICHFCYHPGLSIAANCRQCLVEVEKAPKLMPSCQVTVADGMVVRTDSPTVLEARRAMLEFTLVNHPIDCPICDKAGECTLQRHYMDHDHRLTRVDVHKVRKPKVKDIGQHIVLDAERCILCTRCVRFCDEVSETHELTMVKRGDHEELDVASGVRLDNAYSLNVVDICPVGALTSKDFRFQIRAWELGTTDTTCPGCATGCAVELQTKHEHAYRMVPRLDANVNGYWMCDEGRFTYKQLNHAERIHGALVYGRPMTMNHAIAECAKQLDGKKTAVVFSATATCEANLALAELANALNASRFVVGNPQGSGDDKLIDRDKNPNTRGAHEAAGPGARHEAELALEIAGGAYQAVVFVDGTGVLSDVTRQALRDLVSICFADRRTPISEACNVVLPATNWAETLGTFRNRQGRLRLIEPAWRPQGERRPQADVIRELLLAMHKPDTISSSSALTRKLAEKAHQAQILAVLDKHVDARPVLLRFAHSRG